MVHGAGAGALLGQQEAARMATAAAAMASLAIFIVLFKVWLFFFGEGQDPIVADFGRKTSSRKNPLQARNQPGFGR